jgi:predicted AAA+ superfamily ATPase
MEKDIFKSIIIANQERLVKLTVIKRKFEIEKNANYVITGSRRAGKTYLLYQVIQDNYDADTIKKVLYINFEDERLIGLDYKKLNLIIESYQELYSEQPHLFFDEIQNIQNWEKFVRRLADQGYKIFITGSNSTMLSKQIASTLGGRFIIKEILPLSFKEYLVFNAISLKSNYLYSSQLQEVKKCFNEYFIYGGFPEVIKFEDKRMYLSNLFQKLFYGDIIARYRIKNEKALQLVVKKMAESVNNETSVNRIKNLIKSIGIPVGTSTIFEYLKYLNESYLVLNIENYANKIVERETKKKYYFIDNGILMLFLNNQETKLLENMVFLELKRRYTNIYYHKRNLETDFYIPEEKLLIQVSYSISDIETEKREVKALLKSNSELKCDKRIIITFDTEKHVLKNNEDIEVIPVWKWLLS